MKTDKKPTENLSKSGNRTKPLLSPVISELCDAIDKSNVKVTFGIQPNHIEKIEAESKLWDDRNNEEEKEILGIGWVKYEKFFWEKMGKECGWCPFTLSLYYFKYLETQR